MILPTVWGVGEMWHGWFVYIGQYPWRQGALYVSKPWTP